MLIEELIEKAFCDGYEYAQKEFGIVKTTNKMAKKAWENKNAMASGWGVRAERRVNSPMAMMNGTWAKDNGASRLQTRISTSDRNFLKRLSGRNQHKFGDFQIHGGGYI